MIEFFTRFPFGDTIGHFLLMGTFAFLVTWVLEAKTIVLTKLRMPLGLVIVLPIVVLEEVSQLFIAGRTFSFLDLFADLVGILAFGWLAAYLRPHRSGSLVSSCKDGSTTQVLPLQAPLNVDLGSFQIGITSIGAPPSIADPFHAVLTKSDVFEPEGQGIEIGTEDGLLDYGFFTLDLFQGTFTRSGQLLEIGTASTVDDIRWLFGEPYWIDYSDEEIILFYEYQSGAIELQFEFPDGMKLGFVTLLRNGVLSDSIQRDTFGVNKPCPPIDSDGEQDGGSSSALLHSSL